MAKVLDDLAAQVTATVGVMESAKVLINGIADRIAAAVAAAIGNGATEAELAPVQAEVDALRTETGDLQAALDANS